MRYPSFTASGLLLPFVLTACSDSGTGGSSEIVRDSAGIRVVESASPAWRPGEEWTVPEQPRLRIGLVEGEPEYQLHQVRSARRLSDGRIALLNGGTAELRIYDGDGVHLVTAGGSGRGPGEFRYPVNLVPGANDSLVVWDAPMGPVSWFDPQGRFLRQEPFDRAGLVQALGEGRQFEGFTLLPDGSFVINVYLREGDPPEGVVFRPPLHFFRVSPDFSRVDSLGWYGGLPQMYIETGGRRTNAVTLFTTHAAVAGGGDPMRIFAGNGEDFSIDVFSADGRLDAIIRRTDPPRAISPDALDAARTERLAWMEQSDRAADLQRAMAALPPQTHYPAWSSGSALHVDAAGALWVQEYPEPGSPTTSWSVFSDDGDWLGNVLLPGRLTVQEIGVDYVLGVLRDENDVEFVALYDLSGR